MYVFLLFFISQYWFPTCYFAINHSVPIFPLAVCVHMCHTVAGCADWDVVLRSASVGSGVVGLRACVELMRILEREQNEKLSRQLSRFGFSLLNGKKRWSLSCHQFSLFTSVKSKNMWDGFSSRRSCSKLLVLVDGNEDHSLRQCSPEHFKPWACCLNAVSRKFLF